MHTISLLEIKEVKPQKRQLSEWGDRLIKTYCLSVEYKDKLNEFIWVIAKSYPGKVVPEYDDDFEKFLVDVCEGTSFRKNRDFINRIQEKFSLALHYAYSKDSSIYEPLPILICRSN